MRNLAIAVTLAAVVACAIPRRSADRPVPPMTPVPVTACELLAGSANHREQLVRVTGELFGTHHGTWHLRDSRCPAGRIQLMPTGGVRELTFCEVPEVNVVGCPPNISEHELRVTYLGVFHAGSFVGSRHNGVAERYNYRIDVLTAPVLVSFERRAKPEYGV